MSEIEELVANSYHFSRKKVLKELKELNDMGFSDKVICQILEVNPAVLQSFKDGHKPQKVNFIKLKEGLAEIRKQDKDKGDDS
tara:strand:+ start:827 stop:1075 length:249 start_codon:yes stop_codon:yes gene_type:complete